MFSKKSTSKSIPNNTYEPATQIKFSSPKDAVIFTNLIDFSLRDDDVQNKILNLLLPGWELPSIANMHKFKCKLHTFVVCSTLQECLTYSFDTFLRLNVIKTNKKKLKKLQKKKNKKNKLLLTPSSPIHNAHNDIDLPKTLSTDTFMMTNNYSDDFNLSTSADNSSTNDDHDDPDAYDDQKNQIFHSKSLNLSPLGDGSWILDVYRILIQSLTLRQKAYLFSIGSDRKDRKYKLVQEYKDCIVGYRGVDWMLTHCMVNNRDEAVQLGRQFLLKGYLRHVCDDHTFEDKDFWYQFDDNLISAVFTDNIIAQNLISNQKKSIQYDNYTKLQKHNETIELLVTMTITPSTEINLLLDISRAFDLPNSTNNNEYVCKIMPNISFILIINTIKFMLTELWDKDYTQNIYKILLKLLSITQKAKLFSIGADVRDRNYHLKKYKQCFIACDGITWLINAHFVSSRSGGCDLCNTFFNKGYIKHCLNKHKFKDEELFFIFNNDKINEQLMVESYIKQQLLQQQLYNKTNKIYKLNDDIHKLKSVDKSSIATNTVTIKSVNSNTITDISNHNNIEIEGQISPNNNNNNINVNNSNSPLRFSVIASTTPDLPESDHDDD